jgi:hypothetical protein
MKRSLAAVAVLAIGGLCVVLPARAEQLPAGPYQQSCRDIRIDKGMLTAECRGAGGRWDKTQLGEAHRCVGDITNNNGVLACNHGQAPSVGAGRVEETPQQQLNVRCAAMTDLIARERCLNGL